MSETDDTAATIQALLGSMRTLTRMLFKAHFEIAVLREVTVETSPEAYQAARLRLLQDPTWQALAMESGLTVQETLLQLLRAFEGPAQ